MKSSDFINIIKMFSQVTGLGLSVVIPIVVSGFVGIWVKNHFALGNWVIIIAVLLGAASGVYSFIGFVRAIIKNDKEQ